MSTERSSVQQSLQRKLATEGDWSTAETAPDDVLKVEIQTTESELSAAEQAVRNASGNIRTSHKTGILADVRADKVYEVAKADAVRLIGEPAQPVTLGKPVPGYEGETQATTIDGIPQTEGREITGADQLQEVGIEGDGVTVCVLDNAFDINNDQYADEVVGTIEPDSGFADGSFSDYYEAPGAHGDNCADIVASMAPNVNLVLGTVFDGNLGLVEALDYIKNNEGSEFPEVDIVSFSVGYATITRIDGNDFRSQRIDDFTTRSGRNRVFVNSAGNDAPTERAWQWDTENNQLVPIPLGGDGPHWDSPFTDSNDNGLLEFDAEFGDSLENSERLPIEAGSDFSDAPDGTFMGWVNVHWDGDFNTDDEDYEVRLYQSPDATSPVATSRTQAPFESITVTNDFFPEATTGDRIYVEVEAIDATGNNHFDVWAQFGDLTIPSPWATAPRTIGIPSVSPDPDLLAIAAAQAVDVGPNEGETLLAFDDEKGDLATYSSQGPTQDGRRGIDYAGPSHVSTNASGPVEDVFGFNGTSAACPHVAGSAALLYGATNVSTADLRTSFSETGNPIADPDVSGTDNTLIGDGQINPLGAYADLAPDAVILPQALDTRENDTEVGVEVTANEGEYVVVTTVPDSGGYEGEDVVGFTQLSEDVAEERIDVDVSGASPVDHAGHVVSDVSQDTLNNGTVSAETANNVEATDTAPIYSVEQFDWQDERYSDSTGTVDVDTVEIVYNGDIGETEISIDLHTLDENGNPDEFIGVSQNDISVNQAVPVTVDVVEPVDPDDSNPERIEDTIDVTDDFFAMAHLGPAGTDSDGDRIPAQQPALITTVDPGTIGDFAAVEVPTVEFGTQALDLTAGDSEVLVENVTADSGEYIVVTTDDGDSTFEGEAVAGFTQLNSNVTEEDLLIDVSGADPVDHAAHIATDVSQDTIDTGTVSAATAGNVKETSTTAAVYAVSQFDWDNETFEDARKTVTVDSIEILYQGSIGAGLISVDLHTADRDAGTVGAFVGVSREDLAVNQVHTDVKVDVLEPRGPGDDSLRQEDTLTETTEAFAMAHLGPAGTDANDDRIPAQQPALATTTSPGTVGDFSTLIAGEVSIQAQGNISIPPRTLVTDEEEDSRLGSSEYTLDMIKTAAPGDEVVINVGAPAELEYQIELRDSDLNLAAVGSSGQTGDTTESFDLSGLDPGTYLFAPVVDNEAMAVLPLIIEAYDATITAAPTTLQTNEVLEVEATVEDAVNSPPAIEDVMLVGFTDSNDSGIAVRMDNVSGTTWEAEVEGPEADEYQLHVAPRGGQISFEIQSMTIEEETTSGDTSSLDGPQTDQLISVSGAEPLGLSEEELDLTVEVAEGDILSTAWSQQTGSNDVEGRFQFSRPAVNNENVYVGGLDEFVTPIAKNSGEVQGSVERVGNLSDSSPVLYDGTLYVGDGGGLLHAINAADGTVNWSYDTESVTGTGSAVTSTAAVYEDSNGNIWVFFGDNAGRVHAVIDGGSDFSSQWVTSFEAGAIFSDLETGVVFDVPWAFVTTTDGRVLVLDVLGAVTSNPGERLVDFDAPVDSFGSSSPLVDSSANLYIAGDAVASVDVEGTVNAVGTDNLPITQVQTNWIQTQFGGTAGSNPVLTDGVVYVADAEGIVYGLDADDGGVTLATDDGAIPGPVSSRPAVVGDQIVIGAPDGLYVISRYTGDVTAKRDLGAVIRSDPVVRNGNVYVGTEAGEVLNLQNLP